MLFRRTRSDESSANRRGTGSTPVCDQYLLQYARPGPGGECELVIGLDFGTASSKVVIQAPELPGRPCYAVDFGQLSHDSMPNLLPTRLWVSHDGACSLEPRDGARLVKDVKLELLLPAERLQNSHGPTRQGLCPEEAAACYLALLLRFSRKWFLETRQDLVRHFGRFRWDVNLGVPSPCIEDNEQKHVFRRVGKAAWMLSVRAENSIELWKARTELERVDDPEYWETDNDFGCDFEIIPEIAAGAIGYARSDLRREGLHVMVDIGASTVDACSFILDAQEGSDRYRLLIADVKRLGTARLFNDRLEAVNSLYEKHTEYLREKHDPLVPEADGTVQYVVPPERVKSAIEKAQAQFEDNFLLMLRRVIWQTKCRRDPNAPIWKRGRLPILVIGGGSKLQFFSSALDELDAWLKKNSGNDGTILPSAPIPSTLAHSAVKADEHLFLAVAWGLSHRALDIGKMVPADSILDVPLPPRLDVGGRYIEIYGPV